MLDGVKMLARLAPEIIIGASAITLFGVNLVPASAGLRRDYVESALLDDVGALGYLKTFLLTDAH
jgi:hypothetical protein